MVAKPDDSTLPHDADWTGNNQFSILPSPGPGDTDAPTQEEMEDEVMFIIGSRRSCSSRPHPPDLILHPANQVMFVDPDFGAAPDSLGTADAANATWVRAPVSLVHLQRPNPRLHYFTPSPPPSALSGRGPSVPPLQ